MTLEMFFDELVRRHIHDAQLVPYVGSVLADFTRTDRLYRIHDARGRRLEEVAQMLVASNPILDANSFDREREVRKHIGDFTMFFAGFFPEALASYPRLNPLSVDAFVDYVAAGKESYAVVAAFNLFEYRDEAPLFRRLSERFEDCVNGLHLVKREIDLGQFPLKPPHGELM
ncbi:MAG TPA: hypothetical protein VN628_12080 [Vicinamibacterales bacterium]|nr:hypothetical protein [Vicinamibacterales bacterium]